jgi:acetyl-CoA synthetase
MAAPEKAAGRVASVMQEDRVFPPSAEFSSRARIGSLADYQKLYDEAKRDLEGFWHARAQALPWMKPYSKVLHWEAPVAKWFVGGQTNASAACLDVHIAAGNGEKTALVWVGEPTGERREYTYKQLHAEVCKFAAGLEKLGVKPGEVVSIYMPMTPELVIAMLACARIGAVHSVIFGGFSPDSIAGRIQDCDSRIVITADEGLRGGKVIPLKRNVDEALEDCPQVSDVIVIRRTRADVPMTAGRDVFYSDVKGTVSDQCDPEPMNAEDPLFILYTSGSTGKPKGVLHTTGGYLVWASYTHELVFDYRPGEVFWCTADVGWVTGHSYVVYGPLANGATSLIFEGVPSWPDNSRFWRVVDKHKVEIFYTAPTAIRALMRDGEGPVKATSRASLRLIGTVGEPINPEAWLWYHRVVGDSRCPIVDTYWQTETGACLASPLPGATDLKPGS